MHKQPAPSRLIEREEGDIVVVVAELPQLRGGALLQRIERRRIGKERIAPAQQHLGAIARGDMMGLVDAGLDLLEGEAISARLRPGLALARSSAGPNKTAAAATPSVPRITSRRLIAPEDDVADRVARGRAQRHIVVGLVGLGPVAELSGFAICEARSAVKSAAELRAAP